MATSIEIKVPDIGDFDHVDVVEVLVSTGDTVRVEESLITLESDKASMEVPSTHAGRVTRVAVKVGDQVGEGDLIVVLEPTAGAGDAEEESEEKPAKKSTRPEPHVDAGSGGEAPGGPDPRASRPRTEPKGQAAGTATAPEIDLLVLGSGPGGYTAAFRAADLGLRVTLVERYPTLGGVCLNVGCIPSKALLHAARVIDETEEMAAHGLRFGRPEIDLGRLREFKNGAVGKLTGGLAQLVKRRKVSVVTGVGRFAGPHELEVTGPDGASRRLQFAQAVVAVGSRPVRIPGIPYDDPRVIGSTGALELPDVPGRLLVVGGGIIGLELATVFAALGSSITVVELTASLMPGTDPDLVKPLRRRLEKRYEAILLETRVSEVVAKAKALEVLLRDEKAGKERRERYDRVLVAVGRRPNGDEIEAAAAGLEVDQKGFLPVDDQMRTNVPHIFAIGDVARPPLLAHKAMHEGKVAAEVAAGHKSAFLGRVVPSVAYTDPEVAWVGMSESDASAAGVDTGKGIYPWAANGRSLSLGRSEGLTKLVFAREGGRLLGGGVVGTNAGELIAEIAHAIEMGAVAEDLALTVHAHPTLSETVGGAAEVFEGVVTDLYAPRATASWKR